MKKYILLVGLCATSGASAQNDSAYLPLTPEWGRLSLPVVNINGVPQFSDVELDVTLSNQRILGVRVNSAAAPGTSGLGAAEYQPGAFYGIGDVLSVPVVRIDGQPQFKFLDLALDWSAMRFQLLALEPFAPVLLGAYTQGFVGDSQVLEREIRQFDAWAGTRLSIAGLFMDIEGPNPAYNIPTTLDLLRANGYTAFINLSTNTHSAADIANGVLDGALNTLGQALAAWLNADPLRRVFLSPLPEMNGSWESYSDDAATFKLAYQHIREVFRQAGVADNSGAHWVFSPNGWSPEGREFEHFYPGPALVDVVAFSAYNWGYCQNAAAAQWQNPEVVFGPYLQRMQAMAPDKPIFIAQTASSSDTAAGVDPAAKDAWLRDSYAYLARSRAVSAVLYFNLDKECDWAVFRPDGAEAEGYREAVSDWLFGYQAPEVLAQRFYSSAP